MLLNEDNYIEIINSYDRGHWQPLLDLIPVIESTEIFEDIPDNDKVDSEIFQMPSLIRSSLAMKFSSLVYKLGIIISFDWPHWDEGRAIANKEDFDFDLIDIPTKCKLITAVVRNDRFCDGALIGAFETGFILKILQSIKKQLMDL
jgi:hypothetical protein